MFGQFLPCSVRPGEEALPQGCPQCSTTIRRAVTDSGEPARSRRRFAQVQQERVPWVCHYNILLHVCRGACRSVPDMWSRDTAAARGNCASLRATCFCRTATGSMFQGNFPGPPRRWHKRPGDAPTRREPGQNGAPGRTEKNSLPAVELPSDTNVDWMAPGEAPQPLTLNHPASNPGRSSGRGSLLLS